MEKDERQTVLELIIQKSRIASGLPMEDDERALAFSAQTWMEICDPIPSEWLNACFKLAAKENKVTPAEMIRAWHMLVSDGTVAARFKGLPEGPRCEWCNGTGMLYRDRGGNVLRWAERERGRTVSRCSHE